MSNISPLSLLFSTARIAVCQHLPSELTFFPFLIVALLTKYPTWISVWKWLYIWPFLWCWQTQSRLQVHISKQISILKLCVTVHLETVVLVLHELVKFAFLLHSENESLFLWFMRCCKDCNTANIFYASWQFLLKVSMFDLTCMMYFILHFCCRM